MNIAICQKKMPVRKSIKNKQWYKKNTKQIINERIVNIGYSQVTGLKINLYVYMSV